MPSAQTTAQYEGLPPFPTPEKSSETEASVWPDILIVVVGAALILGPLFSGMFLRAAQGEAMIASFAPYMTDTSVDGYRDNFTVLDAARTNIVAVQQNGEAPGTYTYIDNFVRDYPLIDADMSRMIDAIDANRSNYADLTQIPPFGLLPWLLALSGFVLAIVGAIGIRRSRSGRRTRVPRVLAGLVGLALIAMPFGFGLFANAPAGKPLLDGFRPILTTDEVRKVQGYFVTLVAAQGELDSRFTGAVRQAHPDADLRAIDSLGEQWQPMTSSFAALVGTMNDNVENFDAVVALNESTKPLGFEAFSRLGWFFLLPGVGVVATTIFHPVRNARRARSQTQGGGSR
ncbi:hypothetical protein JGU71_19915 [Antrihabitans sp. YC3-6]|uniref:Uncharacterized protein n=1 Tax=Antrihabitans stalagmiti TaxID=2799499 RepID=A0A934NTS4_9NOCA|nr:hypothetical protein [Antrihabitans stalagmiti]MBJ8341157.1 hypothetical protein [Antrihabitans stalagmiti]